MSSRKFGVLSPAGIAKADRQKNAAVQGRQAMVEIERRANAVRENMMRLRALREAAGATNVEAAVLASKQGKRRLRASR
jgi:hypothetical protein